MTDQCIKCGSLGYVLAEVDLDGDGFDIMECSGCGHLWRTPARIKPCSQQENWGGSVPPRGGSRVCPPSSWVVLHSTPPMLMN